MRKHIGYIVLTMALLCGCAQDGSEVHGTDNTENSSQAAEAVQLSEAAVRSWLYDKSVAVTEGLKALSGDEAYLEAFGGTDELVGQVLEWSQALQEKPGEIYIIPSDSELAKMLMESVTGEMPSIEEQTVDYLRKQMVASLWSILNARFGGAMVVASAGIAGYSETFRVDGFEAESQTWLIRYTDELGVCVAFNATGDDVLTVSASFVVWPELTEAEQQELLGDGGLEQLGIERLEASDMQQ